MNTKRSREAIAVSTEVKEGLAVVNNLLEQQLGSRLSYNEVIAFLILQYNKSNSLSQLDLFSDKLEEADTEQEWREVR
jgi:hypothetical protein